MGKYRKTVAAVVGGILTWAAAAYVPDGVIDRAEWFALAVALATALGVYGVSNAPLTSQQDEETTQGAGMPDDSAEEISDPVPPLPPSEA